VFSIYLAIIYLMRQPTFSPHETLVDNNVIGLRWVQEILGYPHYPQTLDVVAMFRWFGLWNGGENERRIQDDADSCWITSDDNP
jgi:hypothetical protein